MLTQTWRALFLCVCLFIFSRRSPLSRLDINLFFSKISLTAAWASKQVQQAGRKNIYVYVFLVSSSSSSSSREEHSSIIDEQCSKFPTEWQNLLFASRIYPTEEFLYRSTVWLSHVTVIYYDLKIASNYDGTFKNDASVCLGLEEKRPVLAQKKIDRYTMKLNPSDRYFGRHKF